MSRTSAWERHWARQAPAWLLLLLQPEPGWSLACPGQEQDEAWQQVEPGLALTYPADHGSHPDHRTEWWYVTGQLAEESGARFGFQFTLFRRGLEPGEARAGESPLHAREVYAGHLVLSDVARGETRFAERLARPSPLTGAARGELDVRIEGWSLARSTEDVLALHAGDPERGFALELALRPAKPLVLHGERGYSHKGGEASNASAYVSWTRLDTAGTLVLDGRARQVSGLAWFDHEFGSSVLPAGVAGWDWFGLQLDDGRELMLFALRGAPDAVAAGTLVERDGTARALAPADFTLTPTARWTSPRTGADYPARWTIAVPSAGLALDVVPLVPDSELVSAASTRVVYFEGPVSVSGSTTGRGYAELTGHAGTLAGRF